jgi:hypothetical protein
LLARNIYRFEAAGHWLTRIGAATGQDSRKGRDPAFIAMQ